jgi:hypothetical protein
MTKAELNDVVKDRTTAAEVREKRIVIEGMLFEVETSVDSILIFKDWYGKGTSLLNLSGTGKIWALKYHCRVSHVP